MEKCRVVYNKTIIPRALVVMHELIANSALRASLAISSCRTRARGIIVNCVCAMRIDGVIYGKLKTPLKVNGNLKGNVTSFS